MKGGNLKVVTATLRPPTYSILRRISLRGVHQRKGRFSRSRKYIRCRIANSAHIVMYRLDKVYSWGDQLQGRTSSAPPLCATVTCVLAANGASITDLLLAIRIVGDEGVCHKEM